MWRETDAKQFIQLRNHWFESHYEDVLCRGLTGGVTELKGCVISHRHVHTFWLILHEQVERPAVVRCVWLPQNEPLIFTEGAGPLTQSLPCLIVTFLTENKKADVSGWQWVTCPALQTGYRSHWIWEVALRMACWDDFHSRQESFFFLRIIGKPWCAAAWLHVM